MAFELIQKIWCPGRLARVAGLAVLFVVVSAADGPPADPVPQAEPPILPVPAGPLPADPVPQPPGEAERNHFGTEISGRSHEFITDRTAIRRLELASRKLADEEYGDAVRLIQAILDREHDGVILDEDDRGEQEDATGRFESLKGRADRLLAELPPEAQQAYELQFGVGAQQRLEAARDAGDWTAIEEISQRFFRTDAGAEATYRLAILEIDRGNALTGALLLDRLRRTDSDRFEPGLSMRLALAAERAGLSEMADASLARWKTFPDQESTDGADNQAATIGRERFERWLAQRGGDQLPSDEIGWPTLTGGLDGPTSTQRVTVAGGVEWTYPFAGTAADQPDENAAEPLDEKLRSAIAQATENARAFGEITLPAFSPVVVGETAVFRTLRDIRAVDTASGRLLWRTAQGRNELFDQIVRNFDILLDEEFHNEQSRDLESQEYLSQYAWRNVTSGSLSTDGRRVYGIDGTGLARSGIIVTGAIRAGRPTALGRDMHNTLVAYDLEAEGRIAWTLGGPSTSARSTGLFFLGPPLPVGRWLFALAEQDGEIHLLAIDPEATDDQRISWRQPLVVADRSILDDPVRRLSGLSPSFANGLLVCPTGTGAVVAVDLRDRTLRWGYRYETNTSIGEGFHQFPGGRVIMGGGREQADRASRWVDSVPRISGRHVLITPRDSDELHCIDRETGELLWSRPRESSLYIGGIVDGRVLVVGSNEIVAVDVATEELQWRTPLEIELRPAGRGIISGEVYYLPTMSGSICSIDWKSGRVLASSDVGGEIGVGNLAAAGGRLVSVSTRGIAGFRDWREVDGAGQAASQSEAIALRGEDRLMHGDLAAGIADLQAASKQGGSERARELLFETLLGGLRQDFAGYQEHTADLQALVETPDERVELARVRAEGFASIGNAVKAARVLLETCEDAGYLATFEPRSEEWRARLDRVIRAELGAIYESASGADRTRIDQLIEQRLAEIVQNGNGRQLEVLATIAFETGARSRVLEALLPRYRAAGDVLRERLIGMELSEMSSDRAASAAPAISEAPISEDAFPSDLQARYRADELGPRNQEARVTVPLPIRLVGSVPERFAGWRFQMDARRRDLIARDQWGHERWRITVRDDDSARGLPASVERFGARFQGPLLAVCVDTTLVVLDTSSGTQTPRVLWSKSMMISHEISFRFNEPEGVLGTEILAPRFGFAGPRVILHGGNRAITAVDSVTGDELWSIEGANLDMDLLGDSEYVALAATPSHVVIRRASDGAPVERRGEEEVSAARLATLETKIIRWEKSEAGFAVVCQDIARGERIWRFEFPPTALPRLMGADRLAVFDPPSGELQVIRWTDGKIVLTTAIEPNPQISSFSIAELAEGMILLTQMANPPQLEMPSHQLGRPYEPFRGHVHGLDSSGAVVWSDFLEQCMLHTEIPRAVPLLITTQRSGPADRPWWVFSIRDARSGKVLIKEPREQKFSTSEVKGLPGQKRIEVRLPLARFIIEAAREPADQTRDPAS